MKSSTQITSSGEKVDLSRIDFSDGVCPEIKLSQVQEKCVFDLVDVRGKVVDVCKTETLEDGRQKQDIVFADDSAAIRVSLWGSSVGNAEKGRSYLLSKFMVREFSGNKYLSMRKDLSTIEKIDDLKTAIASVEVEGDREIKNQVIVGVAELTKKRMCYRCRGKVEPGPGNPPIGKCVREECSMAQKYDLCPSQLFVRLMFLVGKERVTLVAYGKVVRDLAEVSTDDEVSDEVLLQARPLEKVLYNSQEVITAFEFKHVNKCLVTD